jgi:hypothetical protein
VPEDHRAWRPSAMTKPARRVVEFLRASGTRTCSVIRFSQFSAYKIPLRGTQSRQHQVAVRPGDDHNLDVGRAFTPYPIFVPK